MYVCSNIELVSIHMYMSRGVYFYNIVPTLYSTQIMKEKQSMFAMQSPGYAVDVVYDTFLLFNSCFATSTSEWTICILD